MPPDLPAFALPNNCISNKENKSEEPSQELIEETATLESYIADGKLQGDFLNKAKYYIESKDLNGIKRVNEWCSKH